MAEIDLTNRNAVLQEVQNRIEYHFGKTDGTIELPGQLGCAVSIISLAYRAACSPTTIERSVAENGKDVILRRLPTSPSVDGDNK